MHNAASRGHGEVVTLLLDRGADIAVKDQCGQTALHRAAQWGNGEVITLLEKWHRDHDHTTENANDDRGSYDMC